MIEKEIKNYNGRLRINLTKKDKIDSSKVYLFTPQEKSEIEELKKLLKNLENEDSQIQNLKSENKRLKGIESEHSQLQEKFDKLNEENAALKNEVDGITSKYDELKKEYDGLKETNANLIQDINTKEEEFTLVNTELHQVKNKHILAQDNHKLEVDYLKEIISSYETMGFLGRIKKDNPKNTIKEPEYNTPKVIGDNTNEEA